MKAWLIIFGFIGIVLVYSFFSRESAKDFQNKHLNTSLQNFINSGTQDQTVLLKDFTDFEWDSFCVYPPYSITDTNHFVVPEYTLTSPVPNLGSDERWALLFKNSKMKKAFFIKPYAGLSLEQYKYYEQTKQNCFSPNATVTLIIENSDKNSVRNKSIKFTEITNSGE